MAKIKKVDNGEYIGANKYTIKDAGGGKSTVDFAPDSVLTPGTEVGAELLNEMQLNALYTLDTNRVVEGQKEVYVANLEGFTDFTKPDLSFYLKINANNTNVQTYLRLDTTDYLIKCKINDLNKNSIVACRKVGNEIIVLNNYMQRQDDAIWGGLDGGGFIQDPATIKIPGKRYIDNVDNKAYICNAGRGTADIGANANINTTQNYTACNVVDNLNNITNLIKIKKNGNWEVIQFLNVVILRNSLIAIGGNEYGRVDFPIKLKDVGYSVSILGGSNALNTINIAYNWETKRVDGFAIKENSGNSALLEVIVIGNI